jgi:iron(III) transport system substrate-binding protein
MRALHISQIKARRLGCYAVCLLLLVIFQGCTRSNESTAVVYCAQDQVYAEPILLEVGRRLGIEIRPVFDSEAVKTTGLANRLLAERQRPRCDVFWGNEEMRTRQLASMEVFEPTNGWVAFGYRSRRMVINTNHVQLSQAPKSLLELTNGAWQSKAVLAYPLFGTTATHFHALRQAWGPDAWEAWCRGLIANKPLLVDGNSVVVKMVGQGEAWVGLTDSDDIEAGQREGLPVQALPLTQDSLLIPNTVALVRGAPHPEAAQKVFVELQQPWVAERLAKMQALEGAEWTATAGQTLVVNWNALLQDFDTTMEKLQRIFLR